VGGAGPDEIDGMVPESDEREEELPDLKVAFRSDCQPKMLVYDLSRKEIRYFCEKESVITEVIKKSIYDDRCEDAMITRR